MKTHAPSLILAVLSLVLLSGCATITRGTKDTLVVESDPAGANISLSTGHAGKTPTSFKLPRGETVVVTISKEGYETLTINVHPQVVGAGAAGMAGNVLVGGIIGAGIDGFSGAMKDLKPNPVSVKLVKLEAPVVTAATAHNDQVTSASPASVEKGTEVAAKSDVPSASSAPPGSP